MTSSLRASIVFIGIFAFLIVHFSAQPQGTSPTEVRGTRNAILIIKKKKIISLFDPSKSPFHIYVAAEKTANMEIHLDSDT